MSAPEKQEILQERREFLKAGAVVAGLDYPAVAQPAQQVFVLSLTAGDDPLAVVRKVELGVVAGHC